MKKIKSDKYFNESSIAIKSLCKENKDIELACKFLIKCLKSKKKILVIGNGGSFAETEHFVGELNSTFYKKNRKGLKALSLSSNLTALTAWSNDFHYDTFLARQVKTHGSRNDVLLILTTSGYPNNKSNSRNLYLALREAKLIGIKILSLVGKSGGKIKNNSDVSIHIKENKTSIIQECQLAILHYFCYNIDLNF